MIASALPSLACRWPGLAPAGDLLLCVAKEEGKKGDPAKPVVGVADDSPALLAPGGRGGTRRRCRLKQPPRTSPPGTPLLGGSDGLQGATEPLLWPGLFLGRVEMPGLLLVGFMQAFPSLGGRWPGLAPAGDLLLCVAKEEGKKGDPAIPVVRYRGRLPCAARNRRPARNSPAAPAQTAAPDFSACRCAARRYGTGFAWLPSPCGTCRRVELPLSLPKRLGASR